ncbi:MAG: ABC transporter ATP-binding protein [Thermodesulfobacteriota bacterium]
MRRDFGFQDDDQASTLLELAIWRRVAGYTRPYALQVVLAVLLSLLITGADLGIPWLVRQTVDRYIVGTTLVDAERLAGILRMGALMLGLVLFDFIANFAQTALLEWVGQNIMHAIRRHLFAHVLALDLTFFNHQPVGRLVTRMTNDIQNMYEMFTSVIVTVFNDSIRIVGIFLLLFLMNGKLALLLLCLLPVILLNTMLFSRLARKIFREIRNQLARINSFLQETLSGIAIIQLFGREASFNDEFTRLCRGYYRRTLKQITVFGIFMPLNELLSMAAVATVVYFGGRRILAGEMTIGMLVAFLAYIRLFFQPIRELSQKYSIVQSAVASAERIFQLLDIHPAVPLPLSPIVPPSCGGEIRFEGVTFAYEGNEAVLRNVSFTVRPGETIAVVGATGSGKTTLINLLERFYDPTAGRITIDGHDLRQLHLPWLRRTVGLVMQDVFVLPDTVRANIELDARLDDGEFGRILDDSQLAAFVASLPDREQTVIGEGGLTLSAGQKQLLAFARVLARNPDILVLDEATANIDSETEMLVEKAIARTLAGRTNIVIAHRLSTIRRATHIFVMENGTIVQEGTHETLMRQGGLYRHLQELQRQGLLGNGRSPAETRQGSRM